MAEEPVYHIAQINTGRIRYETDDDEKVEYLQMNCPSPLAFTFGERFPPSGFK